MPARLIGGVLPSEHSTNPRLAQLSVSALAALTRVLKERGSGVHVSTGGSKIVRTLNRGAGRPPLVCVHPTSGSIANYLELVNHLDPSQPVLALQSPGLEGGATATDLAEMAGTYIAELKVAAPKGPYVLAGWSFGGLLAFEMASQLAREGAAVPLLILLDTHAPIGSQNAPAIGEIDGVLASLYARDLGLTGRAVAAEIPLMERLRVIHQDGCERHLFPADYPLEEVHRRFEVYKQNTLAGWAYGGGRFRGSALLFRAAQEVFDERLSTLQEAPAHLQPLLRAIGQHRLDAGLGWRPYLERPAERYLASGTHYSMLAPPNVQSLGRAIQCGIDDIVGRP